MCMCMSKKEWVKCSVELDLPHGIAQKDICFIYFLLSNSNVLHLNSLSIQ